MALIKCKECGSQVSDEAKACPHCGAAPPKRTSTATMLVAALVVMFVVMGIYDSVQRGNDASEAAAAEHKRLASLTPEQRAKEEKRKVVDAANKAKEDQLNIARYTCKEFVKQSLHDPESADFDSTNTFWAEEKKGVFSVQVHLRAKNGFNALRKDTINCKITIRGGDWNLLSLKEVN